MIHITQGHEKGIGLEVFFKSLLFLPQSSVSKLILYAERESIKRTLDTLSLPYELSSTSLTLGGKTVKLSSIKEKGLPQSTESLLLALKHINDSDVLVTLPTSKDQLIYNNKKTAGYTEFFRSFFSTQNISMVFGSPFGFTALLSDHIPLREVTNYLTEILIEKKLRVILNGLNKFFKMPSTVVFAGINPHAGESGVLGDEESIFKTPISSLRKDFVDTSFIGPLPGDTLHFESKERMKKLFVYSYHDQGLPSFKAESGLFGINISLGMPFLRLSVDHGTAFQLYGKNKADCRGCLYTLQQALRVINDH